MTVILVNQNKIVKQIIRGLLPGRKAGELFSGSAAEAVWRDFTEILA